MAVKPPSKDGSGIQISIKEKDYEYSLLQSLNEQRAERRFCDIMLKVCNQIYKAHRCVLAARSPLFGKTLKADMTGMELYKSWTCFNISLFEKFLDYLYTGEIDINEDNYLSLHQVAKEFSVTKLMGHCEDFCVANFLTIENWLEINRKSLVYKMEAVSKKSLEFFKTYQHKILKCMDIPSKSSFQMVEILGLEFSASKKLALISRWVDGKSDLRERQLLDLLKNVDLENIPDICKTIRKLKWSDRSLHEILSYMESVGLEFGKLEEKFNQLQKQFGCEKRSVDLLDLAVSTTLTCAKDGKEKKTDISVDKTIDTVYSDSTESVQSLDGETTSRRLTLRSGKRKGESVQVLERKRGKVRNVPNVKNRGDGIKKIRTRGSRKKTVKIKNRIINSSCDRDATGSDSTVDMGGWKILEKSETTPTNCEFDNEDNIFEQTKSMDKLTRNTSNLGIKCPDCSFKTANMDQLFEHLNDIHNKKLSTLHSCYVCEFETSSAKHFYMHMRTHIDGPPYVCDILDCDYSHSTLHRLLSHRMKHNDTRPFGCPSCDMRFKTRTNLLSHLKRHSGEKLFQCVQCDRCFGTKNTLEQHVVVHSDVRPYLCDLCGFSTKYQTQFIAHKRIHTGNVYRCEHVDCGYSTPKRSLLKHHAKTHLPAVRSHTCSTCGKSFTYRNHLVRHERIHLKDKPFKCKQCEYSGTRSDKLKEHVLRYHGENPTAKLSYKYKKPRSLKQSRELSENDLLFVTSSSVKKHQQNTQPVAPSGDKNDTNFVQPLLNFETTGLNDIVLMTTPPPGQMLAPSRNQLYNLQNNTVVSGDDLYITHIEPPNRETTPLPSISNFQRLQSQSLQMTPGGMAIQAQQGQITSQQMQISPAILTVQSYQVQAVSSHSLQTPTDVTVQSNQGQITSQSQQSTPGVMTMQKIPGEITSQSLQTMANATIQSNQGQITSQSLQSTIGVTTVQRNQRQTMANVNMQSDQGQITSQSLQSTQGVMTVQSHQVQITPDDSQRVANALSEAYPYEYGRDNLYGLIQQQYQ